MCVSYYDFIRFYIIMCKYATQNATHICRILLLRSKFRVIHHQKIKSWEDFACPLSLCLYSGFLLFATFQNLRFLLLLPLLSGLLWLHPNLLSALVCTACPCTLWTQSTRVLFCVIYHHCKNKRHQNSFPVSRSTILTSQPNAAAICSTSEKLMVSLKSLLLNGCGFIPILSASSPTFIFFSIITCLICLLAPISLSPRKNNNI